MLSEVELAKPCYELTMSVYGFDDDKRWEDFKEEVFCAFAALLLGAASIGLFMFAFSKGPGNVSAFSFFAGLIMLIPTVGALMEAHKIFSPPKSLGARIRNLPWSIGLAFREWRIKRLKLKEEARRQESLQAEHRKWLKQQAAEKKAELNRLMLEERKQIKAKLLTGGEVSIAADQSLASQGALSEVEEHPYGRSAEHAALNAKVDEILREEESRPLLDDEDYPSPGESYYERRHRSIYR